MSARKLVLLFSLLTALEAQALPTLTCMGWLHNQKTEEFEDIQLKVAPYDAEFLEGEIGQFQYGVDLFYLKQEGVGLIIYDTKNQKSASSTTGFRRIGDTKFREASISLYDLAEDGAVIVAGLQCSYTEP